MSRLLLLLTVLALPDVALAAKKQTRKQLHDKAMKAYANSDFKQAAELFAAEVGSLNAKEAGGPVELAAREKLCLSLFQMDKKDDALQEYKTIKERFPGFEFDDNEVLPETIEFFVKATAPKPAPKPVTKPEEPPRVDPAPVEQAPTARPVETQPKEEIVAAPDSGPREIQPSTTVTQPLATKKPWRWYYLTPFGIGQFLAGSPVRGVIFAILQAGLVAADVALYVHYNSLGIPADGRLPPDRLAYAQTIQTTMNVMFFSMIGSFVLGTIDGAALEP